MDAWTLLFFTMEMKKYGDRDDDDDDDWLVLVLPTL
jgi:hypothetical protein